MLLGPLPCDVNLPVCEALPMIDQLMQHIPKQFGDEVRRVTVGAEQPNLFKFTLSEIGNSCLNYIMSLLHLNDAK